MSKKTETPTFESELLSLDESKLPEVISKRIEDLAEVNSMYEKALKKKESAQKKVDDALSEAQKLVDKAADLGKLSPETHKFFKHEWSSKNDRLDALEACVKDMGQHGADTAEFQKTIVKVQKATLESQSSLMDVQRKQMEYMERTTDVFKFLFGLNAYGIASTQSIVSNLELILSGAKKKDLGEMAKQQLFLVMDQLKSQENLQNSIQKHSKRIDSIEGQLTVTAEKDEEQDSRIASGELKDQEQDKLLKQQIAKDSEHDKAIAAGAKKDEEQDRMLAEQIAKDKEHDSLFAASRKKDDEQDRQLKAQVEKDEEHDRLLAEGVKRDIDQDGLIGNNRERLDALEERLAKIKETTFSTKLVYTSFVLSIIAIILGILHFIV